MSHLFYNCIIYDYGSFCLYPDSCTATQRFIWGVYDRRRAFYGHSMTVGVALACLTRNNRVTFSCFFILSYYVHINVYTFFHHRPISILLSSLTISVENGGSKTSLRSTLVTPSTLFIASDMS
jgi:hypothetical protein